MLDPGAKVHAPPSPNRPPRVIIPRLFIAKKSNGTTQKRACLEMILNKLLESPQIPVSQTSYLYKCAASHCGLPNISPGINESEQNYTSRAKYAVQEVLFNPRRRSLTRRKTTGKLFGKRCSTHTLQSLLSNEPQDTCCTTPRSLAKSLSQDLFDPSIVFSKPRCISQASLSHPVTTVSSKNPCKPRKKIASFLESCKIMEESTKQSARILSKYTKKIAQNIKSTEMCCSFVNKDQLAPFTQRKMQKISNKATMYDALNKRYKELLKGTVSGPSDLTEFFGKKDQNEGKNSCYTIKLAKYSNEIYKKRVAKKGSLKANSYLIYTDRIISKLLN